MMLGEHSPESLTGLVDLSALSMDELALLDGELVEQAVGMLIRPCGGSRVWNNDAVRPGT